MIQKITAFTAAVFWLFIALSFFMRAFGIWEGDPLVPLLGCVFILISSAGISQILEVQKQVNIVKLGTAYNLYMEHPEAFPQIDKADLN
jgi:hypothetical protein